MAKKCILDDNKICDECGECDFCDLNPFKRCDNCGKCIDDAQEYRELKIDDIILNGKSKSEQINKHKHHGGHHEHCCCEHDNE